MYIYIYIYIYTYLPVNTIVRLPHPQSEDSQGQETFLASSADKQTHNYDTRVLKPLTLPINPKVKGIDRIYIYIYIYIYGIYFELRFFDSIQKVGPSGIRTHNLMLTVHTL